MKQSPGRLRERCIIKGHKMRYVIFSDLHGNDLALKKLLDKERPGEDKKFIFCGDICGYYYHEKECIELLESIEGLITVRGNHDQYYIDSYEDEELTEKLIKKYGSSYAQKDKEVLSYLENMPVTAEISVGDKKCRIAHGTWKDPMEGRIYPDSDMKEIEAGYIYISGHTHYGMIKKADDHIWINPGSLGQPRDKKGFSYCVMDDDTMEIEFRYLEVDVSSIIEEARVRDPENKYLEEIFYRR